MMKYFKYQYMYFFCLVCPHPNCQAFTTQRHLGLCKLFILFLYLVEHYGGMQRYSTVLHESL